MVRARIEDAHLIPVPDRGDDLMLQRGPGWSGQASWWYAEETDDKEARRFVRGIRHIIQGRDVIETTQPKNPRRAGRAGQAAEKQYRKYLSEHEIVVSPRHSQLQKRFQSFLRSNIPDVKFPASVYDDLRYTDGATEIMAEIKPTDQKTLRFAIRTAIGQLLDYWQHQRWVGPQIIVVETEVSRVDDKALAFSNGFGLAWPSGEDEFVIEWPS